MPSIKALLSALYSILLCCAINAQSIIVHPYLQDASPTSIKIMWETDGGTNGAVAWGTSANNLNLSTSASPTPTADGDILFLGVIEELSPGTRYFYQVTTDGIASAVHDFITPPLKTSEASFSLVAMSDMQKDGSHPNKFHEVVHDGIFDYFESEHGEDDIADHLGFVMIPGDLVPNGNSHGQWQNDFFGQANPLFAHVPVYPVLGNHENNSAFYFQYFALPENGTPGFLEHWWYKDYSNVRIIGLNSNGGFRIQSQLDWLDDVLDEACQDPTIDFVFAQLHHPHLSELWTPGELDYTGDVITRMETFSTDCGKPSIHFFGHTHGYSRGQSRDHNHLWVNAASAGGAIDNWGEFPNADYEEFSKSIDEYGFVVVDIEAGNDPHFVLKRITRGDQDVVIDNEQQDIITIRKNDAAPQQPVGIFPVGTGINPDCFIMQGDAFNDSGDFHQASQWQVAATCNDFSNPFTDSWKQHENLYDEIDTQASDDLTNEEAGGFQENTSYCWRVRYRDEHLQWSEWSAPVTFTTGSSTLSQNLLLNPGAESGVNNWSITTGIIESLTDGECGGEAPNNGTFYFAVGGLCDGNETDFSEVFQTVSVTGFAGQIDAGNGEAVFGGHLSNFSGSDRPAMNIDFLDASGNSLGPSTTLTSTADAWTLLTNTQAVPPMTRSIKVILTGTRNAGTDNDSYFDDLFLRINTSGNAPCSESSLPVELLSFTSLCKERFIDLSWEVAGETDINGYEVERSTDGISWNTLKHLPASTTVAAMKRYAYRDFTRLDNQQNFYRLKVMEADGHFHYSHIESDHCLQLQPSITLFPNPVHNDELSLSVNTFTGQSADIQIINVLGQEVYTNRQRLQAGKNTFSVSTTDWARGYYSVSVRTKAWQWAGKVILE
jgi:hypothetical protein